MSVDKASFHGSLLMELSPGTSAGEEAGTFLNWDTFLVTNSPFLSVVTRVPFIALRLLNALPLLRVLLSMSDLRDMLSGPGEMVGNGICHCSPETQLAKGNPCGDVGWDPVLLEEVVYGTLNIAAFCHRFMDSFGKGHHKPLYFSIGLQLTGRNTLMSGVLGLQEFISLVAAERRSVVGANLSKQAVRGHNFLHFWNDCRPRRGRGYLYFGISTVIVLYKQHVGTIQETPEVTTDPVSIG
ncbi:hypothetical protein NDU88_001170 [Pleurodeles waltl]|uniref:Uncharacterized protein n=1 Tax=Pleurodeles waltl TaxID=8319 RepID=A0AAV7VAL0_PLEWA|nr:hypothetical protein NDU88_001170 [Pleurodeles waltl]